MFQVSGVGCQIYAAFSGYQREGGSQVYYWKAPEDEYEDEDE